MLDAVERRQWRVAALYGLLSLACATDDGPHAASGSSGSSTSTASSGGSGTTTEPSGSSSGESGLDSSTGAPSPEPAVYPLVERPYTTLQAVWAPLVPSEETVAAIAAGELTVYEHHRFAELGLGVELQGGNPWIEHDELAPGFVAGAPAQRRSLAYLWQSADSQLIDEESPIRFEAVESLYRPHGHLTPQVFEAHVRSARRIHELSPRGLDFVVVAGDITDGGQHNELHWMIDTLAGGVIDPDSGIDDDPVPGPGNDYNDPFVSDGLDVPWYAALGNHETLYNGGFGALTDELRQAAVGDEVYDSGLFVNGFCDGSTEHAELRTSGPTPADPDRVPLRQPEVLQALHDAPGQPAGHGLTPRHVTDELGYFSAHPIEGHPILLVVLDTVRHDATSPGEGVEGYVDAEQFGWLTATLAQAAADRELVIAVSHHRIADFSNESPVSGSELAQALADTPGMVLHLTGHGHADRSEPHPSTIATDQGYWELMLASTVDFPMHTRFVELVDEGTGFLSIYVTNLEHNSPTDGLAHHGRELAAGKRAFPGVLEPADVAGLWADDLPHQNLLLRIAIPDALRDSLATHEWPATIASEATLLQLSGP